MINPFTPNDSSVWSDLARQREMMGQTTLVEMFERDPGRFDAMLVRGGGLWLDYSKNLVSLEVMELLIKAAESCGLAEKIHGLFAGENLNTTENRPALHTALRDTAGTSAYSDDINAVMGRMSELAGQIDSGAWAGATGKPVTDIVNLGIGGSHLGPMLVTSALAAYRTGKPGCHFVANLDSTDIYSVLEHLNPETTIFIIASKSFTTLETLQNAEIARKWVAAVAGDDDGIARHFIAVTACPDKAAAFGIAADNILPMWDWVGGRYSLWSAIGLPIVLSIGMENFKRLQNGAAAMDQHFIETPLNDNLPVLMALLGIWYINFHNSRSHAVLPYLHRLAQFPGFLQQLEMESNGKSIRTDGKPVDYATAGVIWGSEETNGQHSFHQLLHQGTQFIPVDFILAVNPERAGDTRHAHLVANCLAQASVLMSGRSLEQARASLLESGVAPEQAEWLACHQQLPGNRPSNMIMMDRLCPETLGALIALYEHKVFVQGVIWDINSFDQWGVETGKQISKQIFDRLTSGNGDRLDPSTEGLIRMCRKSKEREG